MRCGETGADADGLGRHPVTNDYLPIQFRDEQFLLKEGDLHEKTWDEDALREWEFKENGGRPWSGRPSDSEDPSGTPPAQPS